MAEIKVIKMNENKFQITVVAGTTTLHEVAVDAAYAQKLTGGKISTAALVKKSFEFLLARESNTSILRQFDLPVIGRYFPEYEREMMK